MAVSLVEVVVLMLFLAYSAQRDRSMLDVPSLWSFGSNNAAFSDGSAPMEVPDT